MRQNDCILFLFSFLYPVQRSHARICCWCRRCGTAQADTPRHFPDALEEFGREKTAPAAIINNQIRQDPRSTWFLVWLFAFWRHPASPALSIFYDVLPLTISNALGKFSIRLLFGDASF